MIFWIFWKMRLRIFTLMWTIISSCIKILRKKYNSWTETVTNEKPAIQEVCTLQFLVEKAITEISSNKPNSPLRIDFVKHFLKKQILQDCSELKGKSNRIIVLALRERHRAEGQKIRKHLYWTKQNKQKNSYIKENNLHLNDVVKKK